jgi:FkbM family methyltransferase
VIRHWLERAADRVLERDQLLRRGSFSLRLPGDHALADYQRDYPAYDAFLPFVAARMDARSLVIDVGANCGDTFVAMAAANPALDFVCVEPDPRFLRYLHGNIAAARAAGFLGSAKVVPRAIGTGALRGSFGSSLGTSRFEPSLGGDEELSVVTLEQALREAECATTPALIKSDVDGLDPGVILSAGALLAQAPPLFFECDPSSEAQLREYRRLFDALDERGYRRYFAFDNFGHPLVSSDQSATIVQLIEYCQRQRGARRRSIYYVDVLAVGQGELERARAWVDEYASAISAGSLAR